MAVFEESDATWPNRLDWSLLQNGAISLYHDHLILEEACFWLNEHGYHVYRFDCRQWGTIEEFHEAIRQELNFPDSYGGNLDAFNDSLVAEDVPLSKNDSVLVLFRFDTFAKRYPTYAQNVLDSIARASWLLLLFGHRLVALVQSDDFEISFQPVGGFAIALNPEELRLKRKKIPFDRD